MTDPLTIESHDIAATIALGRRLGEVLQGGETIALVGTLGTGKTHFIKGIAAGLGVPPDAMVTSPTFTLVNEYAGRLTLFHIDAYRLERAEQLEAIGFDELSGSDSVVVVEWADRVWDLVAPYRPLEIRLTHTGATARRLEVDGAAPAVAAALTATATESEER